jgi:hypothetical protein
MRVLALVFITGALAFAGTRVHGYFRKDGTYVHGYERSSSHASQSKGSAWDDSGAASAKAMPKTNSGHPMPGYPKGYCASCERDRRGRIERSSSAKRGFQRMRPCPSTGSTSGPCPGYVIDHIKPLACGGNDSWSNMQWQTMAAAKAKDALERRGCGL